LEIITSSKQKPNEDWLKFVVSARAKQKIKASLNEERKLIASDGKELLDRKLKQFNLRFNAENITYLEKYYATGSATELYFRIAKGKIELSKIRDIQAVNGIFQYPKKENVVKRKAVDEASINSHGIDSKRDIILIGDDFKGFEYQMSKCCNPIPGDKVFGFITISQGIKIHRNNCPNSIHLMSKYAYRCLKAKWKAQREVERLAAIKIVGIDRIGLVNKLTEIISKENKVNMKSISFDTVDGVFEGHISVLVLDTKHLELLIGKFEEVEGVQKVIRWDAKDIDIDL
jgi:GTP pyrophosphokinase